MNIIFNTHRQRKLRHLFSPALLFFFFSSLTLTVPNFPRLGFLSVRFPRFFDVFPSQVKLNTPRPSRMAKSNFDRNVSLES